MLRSIRVPVAFSAVLAAALAISCTKGGGAARPPPRVWAPEPPQANPIPAENAQQGDADWEQVPVGAAHTVELYLDRVSAKAGEAVAVMAATSAPHRASWALYRLGWYSGAGARKVASGSGLSLSSQPPCPVEPQRGYLRCSWSRSASVVVPASAVSGLYLVKVVLDDGHAAFAPLVVKDDRPATLLFQSSVTTAQAYNNWGGESLYQDDGRTVRGFMATAVSFDRPYKSGHGSGQVLQYEALFARFLERYGYDVTYTTNLDVVREGAQALVARGAFLSVGHDEYWAPEERDAVEGARDRGTHALFFGANSAYWKVRFEDAGADGNARTLVCYKQHSELDPRQDGSRTGRFRDEPENRPENELVGVMYESWLLVAHAWTVADATHFLYAGTGLSRGDTIPQIVGYEYDAREGGQPPGAPLLAARSAVVNAEGLPGAFEATSYRDPSGALVFGAGTIFWSYGLDGPLRDARVERMTANVLHEALGLPIPAALGDPQAPQRPPVSRPTAAPATLVAQGFTAPSGVAVLPDGSLAVTDARGAKVLRVDPASGAVSLLAGDGHPSGAAGYDNVPGANARFFGPTGIAADAAGNVYVADTLNEAIRKIANDAAHTTTTFAGALFVTGAADGPGAQARFARPQGLVFDAPRNRLVVADSANYRVRTIDLATAQVATLAGGQPGLVDGPGLQVAFDFPTTVAVAPDGRVFVISSGDSTLKVVNPDAAHTTVTLVLGGAGYRDGPGTTAQLLAQGGLVFDKGALYVSDPGNGRIRIVRPGADAASTTVESWAGDGRADGPLSLGLPLGLALSGSLLLAVDASLGAIRSIPR